MDLCGRTDKAEIILFGMDTTHCIARHVMETISCPDCEIAGIARGSEMVCRLPAVHLSLLRRMNTVQILLEPSGPRAKELRRFWLLPELGALGSPGQKA